MAALAATVALSLPSVAQQRQNGQRGKQTDGTKPYGYWAACPKPERQARAGAPQTTGAGSGSGQCWTATDGTKSYGYWTACNVRRRSDGEHRATDMTMRCRSRGTAFAMPLPAGPGGSVNAPVRGKRAVRSAAGPYRRKWPAGNMCKY